MFSRAKYTRRPRAFFEPTSSIPINSRLFLFQCRGFRATPRRRLDLVSVLDTCSLQTYSLIHTLHVSTTSNWAITLPLTAIIARTVFVLPLSIYAHFHQNRALTIRPLLSAWRPILQNRIAKDHSHLGPAACQKLLLESLTTKRKELMATFGIKRWPAYAPLLQLPIWLLIIETIRRMCGTREGLLGLVVKNFGTSDGIAEGALITSNVPLETSLQSGGVLWFTDLLAPDPLLILPFVLSATLFTNISLSQRRNRTEGMELSKASVRLTRIFQLVALAAGPLTLQVPTAILVYWVSSSGFAIFQNIIIDYALPRPLTVTPCKPVTKSYLAGKLPN